jgi:hypothetical protein
MGRAVLEAMGPSFEAKLGPLQFAVGVPDGAAICARLAALAIASDDISIVNFDLKNAFNCMRRKQIWDGLVNLFPQLLHVFKWSYGTQTELRDSMGDLIWHSSTGVRQGDPLGMLFFCIGFHAILAAIKIDIDDLIGIDQPQGIEIVGKKKVAKSHSQIAYADDLSIYAPTRFMNPIAEIVKRHITASHMTLQEKKCVIAGRQVSQIANPVFAMMLD